MEFKIEKNVPIPEGRPWGRKYPFGDMEVGDSVALPKEGMKRARASMYKCNTGGKKFTCRRQGDGYRVWRIA